MTSTITAPSPVKQETPLLELVGVTKRFGHVEALTDVNLRVSRGEVLALVGDNGAGKSTLIKTISGVNPADEGEFRFDGTAQSIRNPKDSADLGIAFVYQDLALCDNLDVAANLYLGRERTRFGAFRNLDNVAMQAEARRLLDTFKVKTLRSLNIECGSLSGGQRQAISIARSLLGNPDLVVLDEPTAALGVSQTAEVLNLIRRLKEQGHAVILVSHNLGDIFAVADRISVLRLGRNGGEFPAESRYHRDVVSAITGVPDELPGDFQPPAAEKVTP